MGWAPFAYVEIIWDQDVVGPPYLTKIFVDTHFYVTGSSHVQLPLEMLQAGGNLGEGLFMCGIIFGILSLGRHILPLSL